LSFEFDDRVLNGRLRIKDICRSNNSLNKNDTFSRDVDLRMAHAGRERENTYKTIIRQSLSN
jgi:hypothetical protein